MYKDKNHKLWEKKMKLYNTLTQKKEEFKPLKENQVKMYVCGPTVYDHAHLGHARSAITFDVLYRFLEFLGYKVTYVRNYTDIDDKIIKKAKEEGISYKEVAEKYIKSYEEDMKALNVKKPTYTPKVTEHIKDIIDFVKALIEKGYAYEVDGDVYFRVSKFKDYGKLSKRSLEDMLKGARVEINEKKENPLDFALWKKDKGFFPSPWGEGRPGWHIECSTLVRKYLGDTIDIHGGGLDLIFPHHENEIAQSEALTGKPFVLYWVHNGFVMVNKEKMSKSLKNFWTIKDALKEYEGNVLRYFLISVHYRTPIDFSKENLNQAKQAFKKIKNVYLDKAFEFLPLTKKEIKNNFEYIDYKKEFIEALKDDLNTPKALSVIFKVVDKLNEIISFGISKRKRNEYLTNIYEKYKKDLKLFLEILGFNLKELEKLPSHIEKEIRNFANLLGLEDKEDISMVLEEILNYRNRLRKEKKFEEADKIREKLENLGFVIKDFPGKTLYYFKG